MQSRSDDPPLDKQSIELLEALKGMLAQRDDTAVVSLFENLVATHARQLRAALEKARRQAKNEGVSGAQLHLIFDKLNACIEDNAKLLNARLTEACQNEQSKESDEAQKPKPAPQPKRRRALPPNAPVIDNTILVPQGERACPSCGGERVCIGHDVSEVIDIEPARVIIRKDRREKLACGICEAEIARAPLGDKVVSGGGYGSRLVAELVVNKYDDGLPLERQKQRLARLGLDMPSSTMGDQITWATELLKPIANRLFDKTLQADVMHLDGTSLPVLDRDAPSGIKTGTLWGYVGVDVADKEGKRAEALTALYLYTTTGHKNGREDDDIGPEDALAMRRQRGKPHVVADAAGLFDMSFSLPGLTELGCNMHARRYFTKALEAGDQRAAVPINAFKTIYDIEESIRGESIAVITEQRQHRTRKVYDELLAWCDAYRQSEPPKSLLGAALRYVNNHRIAFSRFIDDGRLPIDNGVVERLHRRPAMGRRAYLFAGSDAGAHRAAIAYSVLGTCRLLGINPTDYLCDVLPKLARGLSIARDLDALMPATWLAKNA